MRETIIGIIGIIAAAVAVIGATILMGGTIFGDAYLFGALLTIAGTVTYILIFANMHLFRLGDEEKD